MAKISYIALFIAFVSLSLSACSTNPPEDPRYKNFGTGLPEQHTEHPKPPYPIQPFMPAPDNISDGNKDGEQDQNTQ